MLPNKSERNHSSRRLSHFKPYFKTADRTGFWSIISVGTRLALRCIHPQIHAADLRRCRQGQRWI